MFATQSWEYDEQGRRVRLYAEYPKLPPSTNDLYILGTKLKQKAREYKAAFGSYISQYYQHQILELPNTGHPEKPRFDPQAVMGLQLWFWTNALNDSWADLSKPPSKRAANRYKTVDVNNRIKFVEDCVRDCLDIDDSLTFCSQQFKMHEPDPEKERVAFMLTVYYDPAPFNVPPPPTWRLTGG
jgi:hypothetical protein